MKRILLSSASIVAFAGAAAADVTFSGEATLGYNDTVDGNNGYYSDLGLDITFSAELDNGITVTYAADIDTVGDDFDEEATTLTISSADGSIVYGDTTFAGEDLFSDSGSTGLAVDEADGDEVLKGTFTFGSVTGALSYIINGDELIEQNVAFAADLGGVSVTAAFEEDTGLIALGAGGTFGGADVNFATLTNDADDSSTGIGFSYPMGAVTLSASYSVEQVAGVSVDDNWDIGVDYAEGSLSLSVYTDESDDWGIETSYDMGNGLSLEVGMVDAGDTSYLAATYDLGGGASLLASFVDADVLNADDEYGPSDLQDGTTVELSFAF